MEEWYVGEPVVFDDWDHLHDIWPDQYPESGATGKISRLEKDGMFKVLGPRTYVKWDCFDHETVCSASYLKRIKVSLWKRLLKKIKR